MVTRTDYETVIEQGFDLEEQGPGVMVVKIEPESPLLRHGILLGDRIVRINGKSVRDVLDFQFLTGGETNISLTVIKPDDTRQRIHLEKTEDQSLGIELETFKYRHCGNNCIFCFVDQNAPGMRKPLYFKDEDYRLSFLWGNFTTLTNASKKDLQRIAEQKLAPIYVSIHATEPELRKKLLGIRWDDHLFDKLGFLAEHRIEMHGQIVVCPGINDGEHLEKTCFDLLQFFPALNTVACVPLGLTKYREGLTELKPVTPEYAAQFIDEVRDLQKKLADKGYEHYLYLADEWYLRADRHLPGYKSYGRFPQVENGVGIVRQFLHEFANAKKQFPKRLKKKKKVNLVTSVSAAKFLNEVVDECNQIENLHIQLHPTVNHFYGDTITVSGLLTGHDFIKELGNKELGDLILLPPNCVKQDENIFLDDMTVDDLTKKLDRPVIVCRDGAAQMVNLLIH
jgi:putative radical SAM enzyme (TIGR03279 family)